MKKRLRIILLSRRIARGRLGAARFAERNAAPSRQDAAPQLPKAGWGGVRELMSPGSRNIKLIDDNLAAIVTSLNDNPV